MTESAQTPLNPSILPLSDDQKHVRPLTTAEEDKHTSGQRRVNLIWETTQAVIAICVTCAVIYSAIKGINSELLGNAFVMILTMYFIRTNHIKVGGVGGTDQPNSR